MKVVSLFGGCEMAYQAIKNLGWVVDEYHSFEIDKPAIQIAKKNHPDVIHHGSVLDADFKQFKNVDLVIGGSPCQGFSFAGKQLNFKDPRSRLFFEFAKAVKTIKPKYFLLENVKMKQEFQDIISGILGVKPIFIDSAVIAPGHRKRLYWTNIPSMKAPEPKKSLLIDILEDLPDCPIGIKVREKAKCIRVGGRNSPFGSKQEWDSPFQRVSKKGQVKKGIEKAACLTGGAHSGGNHSDMDIIHTPYATRRYSPIECERIMTLPDNYTEGVSNTQRYKMLGNGFTVAVIEYILSYMEVAKQLELAG